MSKQKDKADLSPPRTTLVGYWLAFKYLALALLAGLLGLDLILYGLFRYGFDRCYGILCLM